MAGDDVLTGSSHRTLFLTRNLPPLTGGMERLCREVVVALAQVSDLTVVGPRGCRRHLPMAAQVFEVDSVGAAGFLFGAAGRLLRLRRERFSLMLGGSGLMAPLVAGFSRRAGARSAIYVHGLDLVFDSVVYRSLFMPPVRRMDIVIANSRNTRRLATARGVAAGKVRVVHPPSCCLDTTGADPSDFRRVFGLNRGPLLLSVGRPSRRKGLDLFVEQALPRILASSPDTTLVVVGGDIAQALARDKMDSMEELQRRCRELDLSEHVRFTGSVDDRMLASAYMAADVHVFPVRDVPGDVEGFGMVSVEAARYGLPSVVFDAGGAGDAVSDGVSGFIVEPGDYARFSDAVLELLTNSGITHESCIKFADGFSPAKFGLRLRKALGF